MRKVSWIILVKIFLILGSCSTKTFDESKVADESLETREEHILNEEDIYGNLSYNQLLLESSLQNFSKFLENEDFEIYEVVINYKSPTSTQLLFVKDNFGQDPYDLLIEQSLLYETFLNGLKIKNELKEIGFLTSIISYSTDYRANERIIRKLGEKWKNSAIVDSLISIKNFNNGSLFFSKLKSKYDVFHIDFKSFIKKPEIEKINNYTFFGSASDQEVYISRLIFLHQESMNKILKSCNEFVKVNYKSFNELKMYLDSLYPEVNVYLSK